MTTNERFQYLVTQFQQQKLTAAELQELQLVLESNADGQLVETLSVMIDKAALDPVAEEEDKVNKAFERIINVDRAAQEKKVGGRVRKIKIFRWVAVACIIALAGIGYYFYSLNTAGSASGTDIPEFTVVDAPATNIAMITLADGSKVQLDSMRSGQVTIQGNTKLVKLANGSIAYQAMGDKMLPELQYNTLTNPRGSKAIVMQLSDGSQVWLNAGSSITYPVIFSGNERKVELSGEGYFEVAKDPKKRFIVSSRGAVTEVLGTHFNVRAYSDETDIRVTLLEGSVSVKITASALKIKPGEQALITSTNIKANLADIDQVMAWKEGYFNFDNMGLHAVLRDLERWYNIRVIYEGNEQPMTFGGNINRNIPLNDVLLILKRSGLRFNWNAPNQELKVF